MRKRVTMQDIADALNLSKNSVSQALSGQPGVSEDTRRKVMETANRLGYRYNPGGRNRAAGRSRNIGLIASEFVFSEHIFFGAINLSIEKEVKARGYSLLIHAVDKQSEERQEFAPFVQENKVDGLLILSHLHPDYIQQIIQLGVPTVLIDHHHPSIKADCILTNNRFGAYEAVRHLVELGHREIGFIGNIKTSPSYQERLEGYRLAMADYGLLIREDFLFLDSVDTEEAIARFIESKPVGPSAWFCVNDTLGFLLNSCLTKLGKRVPQDVSICGFDNHLLSELASPPLTTIHIDKEYFGKRAVDRLFWRMDHRDAPVEEILLPVSLLARGSTAKPQSTRS
ncbi:LacI family DNA-binding transcriptional regulator [Effusibacillus pohliae]|uniref:LacI family DNA-binding transcriptional regulator n=1 Tax=Effusibacillus pohliae TaxID=232270 RepID=UPI00037138DA|nr:substrate-binding domain-containing protein [Effusibacillus pohliae]